MHNNKKRTTEEFIEEMKVVNPDIKILGEYKTNKTKIEYLCECGNESFATPSALLNGNRCKKCAYERISETAIKPQEFIKKMGIVNPNIKITGEYRGNKKKIEFICECGDTYFATPQSLLKGVLCNKCGNKKRSNSNTYTHDEFVEKMKVINPKIKIIGEYQGSFIEIEYICECGKTYFKTPVSLLQGVKCRECGNKLSHDAQRKTIEEFKSEMFLVNPSIEILGEYIGFHKKIKYKCDCGNISYAPPAQLLYGIGCAKCKKNKGEDEIYKYLSDNHIVFKHQYYFKDCRGIRRPLVFDFYLSTNNTCIEFDGKQHYEPVDFFGGEAGFQKRKINDNIKNDYCNKNNINLIRIPYWDFDNIHTILSEKLGIQKCGETSA